MSAVAAARVTATSPIEEITAVLHKCMLRGIPLDPMPVSQRKNYSSSSRDRRQ